MSVVLCDWRVFSPVQNVVPSSNFANRILQVNVSSRDPNSADMNERSCDFCQFLHAYKWVIGPPVFTPPPSVPTDRLQLIILPD